MWYSPFQISIAHHAHILIEKLYKIGPSKCFGKTKRVVSRPALAADNEGKNSNNKSARTYCIETILYLDEREWQRHNII